MKQSSLANLLKFIIIGVGICGLILYAGFVPVFGQSIISQYPELTSWYYPWLIFLYITGIPCYVVLFFAWKIAANIGIEETFTYINADYFKKISILAAADSIFFIVVNIVYLFLNMNHPGVVLISCIVFFFGVAVSIAASALSHLVGKAAELQIQSDFTI